MQLLHNHLGYEPHAQKRFWLQTARPVPFSRFSIHDAATREIVLTGKLHPAQTPEGWRHRHYLEGDFSMLKRPGRYFAVIDDSPLPLFSHTFTIAADLYGPQQISDLLHYFKSQRASGLYDRADRDAARWESRERHDVHGGWFDASGDCSKYLSHLSYANSMNPQQTPMVAWNLMEGLARLQERTRWFAERMVDEALHGADFLVRMQHADGYFFMTLFDKWSKDPDERILCAYATQQGIRSPQAAAGWRQGGGMAIAALARATSLPRDGEFERAHYLSAARRGFTHLQETGTAYLDDGQENIIDDYCALLAASELYAATGDAAYRSVLQQRTRNLVARQDRDGFFWSDDARTLSYMHAVDAGLPLIALMRARECDPDSPHVADILRCIERALHHDLAITQTLDNPFGYPAQTAIRPGEQPATRFFMPHDNPSGYWWQGENARLGSLAAACQMAIPLLPHLAPALQRQIVNILGWLCGANPFDTCMVQGWGHNHPCYEPGFYNAPGGVCNGITSHVDGSDDIDFRHPGQIGMEHSWRWTEQWLPHAAWLFLALATRIGQRKHHP